MSPSACGQGGAKRLAVKAYIDGERHLDEGNYSDGLRLLRRAITAEPELDADEWPEWACLLREGLEKATDPPYATSDIDLRGVPITDEQLAHAAAVFRSRHFVIVDGLQSHDASLETRAEIEEEDAKGGLQPVRVYASARNHVSRTASAVAWRAHLSLSLSPLVPSRRRLQDISVSVPDRRSDRVKYLDFATEAAPPDQKPWRAVRAAVEQIDHLVRRLRERLPVELGTIVARQRPMISAYAAGCGFERHCDNHCDADEAAYDSELHFCANRRRLSAVLYCVPPEPQWGVAHGGALRIFLPTALTGGWRGDDALVDVMPRPGRLILFASDQSVPHEVLPVRVDGAVRYAIALWFLSPTVRAESQLAEVAGAAGAAATVEAAGAAETAGAAEAAEAASLIVASTPGGKHLCDERESATSVMSFI